MDIILPAWLFVTPKESKDCEAFIYLILVTNSFISLLAAFNISFQRHLVETEYKLIANQILTMIQTDHLNFVSDILYPDKKKKCKLIEQAFDFGETKEDLSLHEKLSPLQNFYMKRLVE